jgi:hypothetical protein
MVESEDQRPRRGDSRRWQKARWGTNHNKHTGYKQVLEDGPEFCSSESEAEYSDHGEVLEGAYPLDMLDADGKPILNRATMTSEQANELRARGRAGGRATVSGKG